MISIHAPLAGCDRYAEPQGHCPRDFNPRTPCGVRLLFLGAQFFAPYFNPRTPCGVRRVAVSVVRSSSYFNPRTPCGVRLYHFRACAGRLPDFNPRTPCGVRLHKLHALAKDKHFNPRTPCGVRRKCMPLRYNKDKREKPVFSMGLSVCRSHFNSFSNIETDAKI